MSRDNETPDSKQNKTAIVAEQGANVRREFLKGAALAGAATAGYLMKFNAPGGIAVPEASAADYKIDLDDTALRVRAIESLLVEKGLVQPAALAAIVQKYETQIGPHNGAAVVARAWTDPAFKTRLLAHGTSAIAELGFSGVQGEDMVVVENTPAVHNVVVCTLCSCYPWPTLGLPPNWYKSAAYRSRVVIDPRSVLAEFGVTVPADKEIRVWDSNAELRYLVLPERPPGSEGLDAAALAKLVTRDSMIGTGVAKSAA
jgi:nitrile hydratase